MRTSDYLDFQIRRIEMFAFLPKGNTEKQAAMPETIEVQNKLEHEKGFKTLPQVHCYCKAMCSRTVHLLVLELGKDF